MIYTAYSHHIFDKDAFTLVATSTILFSRELESSYE